MTVDDGGFLTVVDRKKEIIINAAGKNTIKAACSLTGGMANIGDGRPCNTALTLLDAKPRQGTPLSEACPRFRQRR